ncbi:hypothetical protein HH310_21125 [Actinoplanes sp. TBRC 11911]|uniref:glycosyltransferase n=1 Tax=Actinoplanes sp. TBRC 11911 TaxID=2729386 RepID=UPI00145D2EAC|nr:nucleotide disphospho-sugar-binding domain-containing protein [Actinoplanes sp. TBRC 11911]NMO53676.1 hypothetical protein [Actinoplanes sp. TBRC 11911]
MSNVVIAGYPELANMNPLLAIGRDLVARGHTVVIYTGARFEDHVRSTGACFRAFPAEVDFDDLRLDRHLAERENLRPGLARMVFDMKAGLIDPIPVLFHDLRALIKEFAADVVLSEQTFLPVLALAGPQRPTLVTLGTFCPMFLSADTAPPGAARPPQGRARNRAMNAKVRDYMAGAQAAAEGTFATLGVPLEDYLWNAALRHTDHYLQLSIPSFEYRRGDVPAHFRFVGPILPALGAGAGRRMFVGGRPIVAVSDLVVPSMLALADNGHAEAAAPLDDLVPRAEVLITDGNADDVHLALRHGVPSVVAASAAEEAEVAARLEWTGTGINLHTGTPTLADIRGAVQTILRDRRFRTRTEPLMREATRSRPFDAIAEIVEEASPRPPRFPPGRTSDVKAPQS